MPRGSARATLDAILVARCVLEGALFAALSAAAQVGVAGDRPVPVVSVALLLTGVGIVLASVLRDARAERQNTAIALVAIGAAAACGVLLRTERADGLQLLTRIVAFGILGEAFVWRNVSVARGLVRWSESRNAVFVAGGVVVAVAVLPGAIDRSGLAVIGLLVTAATGVGLSLARSAEELALSGTEGRGGTSRTTASGAAILLAIVSIVSALIAPYAGELLASAGRAVTPAIGDLIFNVLLVLGYLAAVVVELFRAFFNGRGFPNILPPRPPVSAAEDAEAIRQIEAARPFVIGAVELIVAAVALVLVIILVDRMARERRQSLPDGATLDREPAPGEGLGAFLAGLLPRRSPRARAPRDDGTPAGALRALYWRYLARGEAAGVSWRSVGETPAEHQLRAAGQGPGFAAAAGIVRAFEELRYGDRDPDAPTLAAARTALAAVEPPR